MDMSDTSDTPQPEAPATNETPAVDSAATAATTTAAAATSTSRRGVWRLLGAGAAGLVIGVILTGLVSWGFSDDGGHHRDSRPGMSQQKGGDRQMPRGQRSDGPMADDQMPGGQMPGGRGGRGGQMPGGPAQGGQGGSTTPPSTTAPSTTPGPGA